MAKKTYWEKLKDPRWQKKRLEVLERAGWVCEGCYDTESTFHVHHKVYFKGREPWEYDVDQLAVLCEECHQQEHESPDVFKEAESRLPLDGPNSRHFFGLLMAGALSIEVDADTPWEKEAYKLGSFLDVITFKATTARIKREKKDGKNTNDQA